jgi:hypothetical protein
MAIAMQKFGRDDKDKKEEKAETNDKPAHDPRDKKLKNRPAKKGKPAK